MTDEERKKRKAHVKAIHDEIRPLAETHPHLKDFAVFLEEFNEETERGAALAAAAFLDDLLLRTISAFLLDDKSASSLLEGFNAPLGNFSARIAAAYAMGLISELEKEECDLIRKIRNEFAHRIKMSFDNPRVKGLCSALRLSVPSDAENPVGTRGQFSSAAVLLILNLTNRPYYVGQKRLRYQNWRY